MHTTNLSQVLNAAFGGSFNTAVSCSVSNTGNTVTTTGNCNETSNTLFYRSFEPSNYFIYPEPTLHTWLSSYWLTPYTPKADTFPSYPVNNYYVEKDGTNVIEVAVTGFRDKEIKVEISGSKLTVVGKQEEKEEDRKYLNHKISQRDFEMEYELPEDFDVNNIKAEMELGLLNIRIPLKPEKKPVQKNITINS